MLGRLASKPHPPATTRLIEPAITPLWADYSLSHLAAKKKVDKRARSAMIAALTARC